MSDIADQSASAAESAGETVIVNDTPRPLHGTTTLAALAAALGLADCKGVAVAVNGTVVPRANWPGHRLADRDRVLVIRATQGG